VWIGHGAIVLPGVSIGTGAAVGAGAVVTKDLPPFAVAVGVPVRVLRFRFAPQIVAPLQRIAW
jgi:acetyltransferase-like isoleucine patch superfamily enzyme